VARKYKGLVLTSHNPYRVRDVSHFEKFIEFHEKMYYYVDPISITPFSSKAVYKYLPLYLATIIRHKRDNLQNNRTDAIHIIDQTLVNSTNLINEIKAYFRERMLLNQNYANNSIPDVELREQLNNLLTNEMESVIEQFIDGAIQQWIDLANEGDLWYYNDNPRQNHNQVLYTETEDYDDARSDSYWTVPNSLRIVEQEAVLKIQNLY
jgi:plasmid maintenance system antidote protein VapI